MGHDCEHEKDFAEIKRDIADLAVDVSAMKDCIARMDKSVALMEQAMTHLAEKMSEGANRFDKHIDEGKSWRASVALAWIGIAGSIVGTIYGYGVLSEKVAHAEKYVEARVFG